MALALATKFNLDRYEKNTIFFGMIVGLHKKEMRQMTDYFIKLLDFELYINDDEYQGMMSLIKTLIAEKYASQGQIVVHEKNVRKKSSL